MGSRIFSMDLGGTNIKFAVLDEAGDILAKDKIKTPENLESLLASIHQKLQFYQKYSIDGIAISSPGAVSDIGVIYGASSIPYIHGPNIKEVMECETGLPVQIENDANCAALAEVWKGSAKGREDVAVVVLGTGVGGAIIKNGIVHKGANLHAGEFGYMILNPENPGSGMSTFSEVASTSSIIRRVARNKGVDEASLTGEEVFQFAENGDEVSITAISEFYRMLAIGIYNIQYAYDPALILIGGGISDRDDLIANVRDELNEIVNQIDVATIIPVINSCHFSADANLIGAVYHFLQHH